MKMLIKGETQNNSDEQFKMDELSSNTATTTTAIPANFNSPEALQTELERMLAQLSREAIKREADEEEEEEEEEEEDEEENGRGESEEGDEADEDGDEDEDEEDMQKPADQEEQPKNKMADGIVMLPPTVGAAAGTTLGKAQKSSGKGQNGGGGLLPNGKKTKGRVKIKMEYIGNKLRRYTTFSKRKTGIMKKANELSTLTGTQVMLLVASETGHVYAYATRKLKPMILSEPGKMLIQNCLNAPEDQIVDPAPTRTEFTFEPPGLGGLNNPIGMGSGGGGGTNSSGTNSRKRKAAIVNLLLDTNSIAIGGGTIPAGTSTAEANGIGSLGMPSAASSSSHFNQLLLNGSCSNNTSGTTTTDSTASAEETGGQQQSMMGIVDGSKDALAATFEELFAHSTNSGRAAKRARKEEPSSTANSSSSSPSPTSTVLTAPAATAPTMMDAQQQLKTIKEVLKAATANRIQIQRQNGGHQPNNRNQSNNKKAAGTAGGTATTKAGKNQRNQQPQQHQQQTSSQQLGAALLPILLQGLITNSTNSTHSSSACSSPSTSLNASSAASTASVAADSLRSRHQQPMPMPITSSSFQFRNPNLSRSALGKASTKSSKNSYGSSSHSLPILYQMPQGVVYATGPTEADEEEQPDETNPSTEEQGGEEADAEERMTQNGTARLNGMGWNTKTRDAAASCMAAVCSSAAAAASTASSNSTASSSFPGMASNGGLLQLTDETAAGNALHQLLNVGLLPLTMNTMTQQILTAMKGAGGSAASPRDD